MTRKVEDLGNGYYQVGGERGEKVHGAEAAAKAAGYGKDVDAMKAKMVSKEPETGGTAEGGTTRAEYVDAKADQIVAEKDPEGDVWVRDTDEIDEGAGVPEAEPGDVIADTQQIITGPAPDPVAEDEFPVAKREGTVEGHKPGDTLPAEPMTAHDDQEDSEIAAMRKATGEEKRENLDGRVTERERREALHKEARERAREEAEK